MEKTQPEIATQSTEPEDPQLPRMSRWERVLMRVAIRLISCVIKTLALTYRMKLVGGECLAELDQRGRGYMMLIWHGRVLPTLWCFRGRPIHAMVSLSRDGEYQVHFFRTFGWPSIRGSSGRGGVRAMARASRLLKDGKIVGITPDGPKGPPWEVQQGTAYLAKKTGCPVIPVGAAGHPGWHLKAWDDYTIPKPFSRAAVVVGTPMVFDSDEEIDLQAVSLRLKEAIDAVQAEAERLVGC